MPRRVVILAGTLTPLVMSIAISTPAIAAGKYTTRGSDIVDRATGERVLLRGFGLGGWLLPEGYMWGIRELDRPRQFEAAIVELIGKEDAAEFWRLYHANYVTESDIAMMKAWGANSVRIALLASMLQPREGQPEAPPYRYDESAFRVLDRLVDWCERYEMGVIWDLHGAPGGQNAENISDSDGTARLWTEREKYWPRCIDLWMTIVKRYADRECIVGYDLLNEPLLRRYPGIDPALLRELYVELTKQIRTVDRDGIIFIEGDDWAQEFSMLEPLDWDPHLVVAFHSYPPVSGPDDLARWERLRKKYDVPLWHGETGEVGPPYAVNRIATRFLEQANVGWSWWTHKKFERMTQPWMCPRNNGFEQILAFWKGEGEKPAREDARRWLFEQAHGTRSDDCVLIPEMVNSLAGLDFSKTPRADVAAAPRMVHQPNDVNVEAGGAAEFLALAQGASLKYQWLRDGKPLVGADGYRLRLSNVSARDDGARFSVRVSNEKGEVESSEARLEVEPFKGPSVPKAGVAPKIDGLIDDVWQGAPHLAIKNVVFDRGKPESSDSASFRLLWDDAGLYVLVEVEDDVRFDKADSGFENDCVEVFVDADNSKSDVYGDGDYWFRCVWGTAKLVTLFGAPKSGELVAQAETRDGYVMEFALPWSMLGGEATPGRYLGLDVHVTDNDGRGRALERAWHTWRDNSHQSPSYLGTVRLASSE